MYLILIADVLNTHHTFLLKTDVLDIASRLVCEAAISCGLMSAGKGPASRI